MIAAICMLATRRRPVVAVLAGLGTVVALHLVDLVTGAHLEWNTVFGYSATIGIRFVGQGNMTFSQLTAAAVLFAGLLAWQVPTRRGVRIAVALLAVTVIVMGAPFWGNDFGGAVAAAPGFALLAWLLLGHELRWRTVWVLGRRARRGRARRGCRRPAAPARPAHATWASSSRRPAPTSVARRWCCGARRRRTSRRSATRSCSSAWSRSSVLVAYLWWVRPRSLRALFARVSTARVTAFALGIVALLGFALNDSGITIPSMMAAVFEATVVILLARVVFAPAASETAPPESQPESQLEESRQP